MDMLNDSKNQLEKNTDKSKALHNFLRANFSKCHLQNFCLPSLAAWNFSSLCLDPPRQGTSKLC